jgi:hypothetical protein
MAILVDFYFVYATARQLSQKGIGDDDAGRLALHPPIF